MTLVFTPFTLPFQSDILRDLKQAFNKPAQKRNTKRNTRAVIPREEEKTETEMVRATVNCKSPLNIRVIAANKNKMLFLVNFSTNPGTRFYNSSDYHPDTDSVSELKVHLSFYLCSSKSPHRMYGSCNNIYLPHVC